ncbi:uncharacterized protein PG986_000732 [Apiospora aurea]|uniref:CENP-V/GFA domain-containing protein n=1 Tax=Apiospora aurea TaxID=335848 RepID=A0ABR1QUW5_9PEZI
MQHKLPDTDTRLVKHPKSALRRTVGDNPNVCRKHKRIYCPSCVFYLDPDNGVWEDGRLRQGPQVYAPGDWAERPLFGSRALFDTVTHYKQRQDAVRGPGEILGVKLPPSVINPTPDKTWFIYCPKCQLAYLIGSEGHDEAANHPAHLAQSDPQQRSIAVFIDGVSEQATTTNNKTTNENQNGTWTGRFCAYYGPHSRYNGDTLLTAYHDESHLLYAALSTTLAYFAHQVPRRRLRDVRNHAVTNSHRFLRDCTVFRLFVLVGPGLHKFLPLLGPVAEGPVETEALLAAQAVGWKWNAARLKAKESIATEVRNLAGMGILVEWCEFEGDVCPLP